MARSKKNLRDVPTPTIPRNYDIYSIENRVHELEKNAGGSTPSTAWDYSTTETNTNQKWIDGKDIYCTVITGINLTIVNDWRDINGFDATPVESIVNVTVEGDDGTKGQSITGACIVAINSNTKKFCILKVATYDLKLQRIIVFYTKNS